MGNRIKGKTKKKSIKSASHSGMGSSRKLSRMGKKRLKDRAGIDATFIGRAACLRRLQISLKDFRRLCILKGVYPREPRGRAPGNKKGQVYYHVKDVRAIAHEPVLEKFREFRSFMKKVRRAAGRNEKDEAARKFALAPSYTLHHLVRERYPRFVDALGDMDDALTLVHLFAALPADGDIRSKVVNKAKTMAASWSAYCATTSSITKSFISIKGVYIEANVMHTTLRWVVPHAFTQNLPDAVDYKVMLTFFEFYETLLGFVLFKLYNDIGVRYPLPVQTLESGSTASAIANNLKALTNALSANKTSPVISLVSKSMETTTMTNAEKKAVTKKERALIQSVGAALKSIDTDEEVDDEDDEEIDVAGPLSAALESLQEEQNKTAHPLSMDEDATKRRRLFSCLTFFLSREIPRGYLELVCLAFGAKVGWEGDNSPIEASDASITHHVVDRPKLPSSYDKLPKSREFIQPQWILDSSNFMFCLPIAKYGVGAELPPHLSPWVDDEEEGYKPAYATEIEKLRNGEALEDEHEMEVEKVEHESEEIDIPEIEALSEAEEEDDDEDEVKANKKAEKEDADAHDRAKVMMSRKASRLYGRMQNGLALKEEQIKKLQKRRDDMKGKFKDASGKTVTMQKLDRLKKERKTVGDEYTKFAGSMKKNEKRKATK